MSISSALSALVDDVTAAKAKITSKGGGVSTKKMCLARFRCKRRDETPVRIDLKCIKCLQMCRTNTHLGPKIYF